MYQIAFATAIAEVASDAITNVEALIDNIADVAISVIARTANVAATAITLVAGLIFF